MRPQADIRESARAAIKRDACTIDRQNGNALRLEYRIRVCVKLGGIFAPGEFVVIRMQHVRPWRSVVEDGETTSVARFDVLVSHGNSDGLGMSRQRL